MINQAGTQMNTPPPIIALKHVFGINSNLKNHVHYINESKVLYPAGHNIVILNTDDKSQVYINGADGYQSFSCMAVSPIKKYLAIAEKGEKPGIFIYDTTKLGATRKGIKKSISLADTPIKDITAINFVPGQEDKYLVFMTGQPDVHLYYYQWDKKKPLASFKVISNYEMTEVAVNPTDPNSITCLGPRIFRGFRLQDGELKIVASQISGAPGNVSQNYTAHTWLSDGNIVVGTSNGELILLNRNCEFIKIVDSSLVNNCNIECIIQYSKGFIVAGDNFTIYFYDATFDEQTYYTRTKTVLVKNASTEAKEVRITALSIVPAAENKILCATQNNHIYTTNLKSELQLGDEYVFENLMEPVHFGGINGMDICVRKPLIVTCGTDCSIRVWNFETFSQECVKFFAEEALSVSIHPSGFHVLASFSDRIKMMNIGIKNSLHEEANPNKEYSYIKGCRLVKFSNGGQYFAVVNGGAQNNQYIQIFTTYTGESPKYLILKGHSAKIRSIVWSRDDHYIMTCGTDGLVYIWKVSDGSRISDCNARVALSSAVLMGDNRTAYAVGKDKSLKKIAEPMEVIDAKAVFGQIAVTNSNKVIFTGAADENVTSGFIRCYKMPVLSNAAGEYQAHDTQGVEAMRVTFDDQYLITAGKDGVLCVFEIKDKEARGMKLRDGFVQYSHELVVSRKELEDMRNERDSLKGKKSEDNLFQQTEISEKEENIKQLRERQRTLTEADQLKYANLQNNIKETEQKNIEIIEARKKEYESELVELESHHQTEAVKKASAYQKHKEEQERRRDDYKKNISSMIDDHNRELKKSEDDYVAKIEEEVAQKESILLDKQRTQKEHEETIKQIEEETDREKGDLEQKNASEIKNKTDEGLKSKGDVSIAKKKHEQQKKQQADLLENEKEYKMRKDELEVERQKLKNEIEDQKAIISLKDDSISEKEKRIYELKKRTQELEKFKAVLDFKIKELKKDIGPREEEIAKMKLQTNEMDGELKKFSTLNNTLGLVVDELDEKQKAMHEHIRNQRDTISKQRSQLKEIKDDIYMTVQCIQNYDALRTEVEKMKKKYAEDHVRKTDIDPDIYAEYVSQRKYLEKSVAMLKRHLQKDTEMHKHDNLRIMKENVGLIKKINNLRKGIDTIKLSAKGTQENPRNGMRPQSVRVGPLKENRDLEEAEQNIKERRRLIDEQKQHLKQLNVKYQTLIAEDEDEHH